MRIQSIQVQNFRSIQDATLKCDNLTALVGANGAGKSTFLRALEVFYDPDASFDEYDFYACNTEESIKITVTYELDVAEQTTFSNYLNKGNLVVKKELKYGSDNKPEQKYQFEDDSGKWGDHPFFFSAKSRRKKPEPTLENYTRFLFIPAIRDAAVESLDKSKGDTVIGELMNIVRSALTANADAIRLRGEIEERRKEIAKLLDLHPLMTALNETMKAFAPNTNIVLGWAETAFIMPDPQVNVQLSEDGYETSIERTGHGVQRAFIITLLQQLAASSRKTTSTSGASSAAPAPNPPSTHLILAIEEPELFQHPSRQRHFARVLYELAHNKRQGIASSVQVLYCTHSPLFVNFDWFEKIRLIRKVDVTGQPKQTSVAMCPMSEIPAMSKCHFSSMLSPAINEGFFAERIILVEGDGDKAYLEMVARCCFQESLEAHGIVVIAVGGKGNIIKPLRVFPEFGIPVYPVWDNDMGNAHAANENKAILEVFN